MKRQCGFPCYCVPVLHFPRALFMRATFTIVEPESTTIEHKPRVHLRSVKPFYSHWWRSVARSRKGAAFTEKMNVGTGDGEFTAVDVESRISEHEKRSNDPPPEFTGTKPSEFKSYRKKLKLGLMFTRTPSHLQGPRVLSRL